MPPKKRTVEQILSAKASAAVSRAQASIQNLEQLLQEKTRRALVLQAAIKPLLKSAAHHEPTKTVLQHKQHELGFLLKEIVDLKLKIEYFHKETTQRARTSEEQLQLAQTMVDVARVAHHSNKVTEHVASKIPGIGNVLNQHVNRQTELLNQVEAEFDTINLDPESLELTGQALDTDPGILSDREASILHDLGLLEEAETVQPPNSVQYLPAVPTHPIRISKEQILAVAPHVTIFGNNNPTPTTRPQPQFQMRPNLDDSNDLFSI